MTKDTTHQLLSEAANVLEEIHGIDADQWRRIIDDREYATTVAAAMNGLPVARSREKIEKSLSVLIRSLWLTLVRLILFWI
jgi:Tfp pilus assembly protein PilN